MLSDDLIALRLRGAGAHTSHAILSDAIHRLLTLLNDIVAVIDLADDGALRGRLAAQLRTAHHAADERQMIAAVDGCIEACRDALARIDSQRVEQRREIASLVDLVREALAIVAGSSEAFHATLGSSVARFEALVQITDIRLMKLQLVQEVRTLRQITVERQKEWTDTCQQFSQRVETLETELEETKQEAALDALSRVSNRRAFDRACREWLASKRLQFVLAVVDIDQFKRINDTYGHPVGDQAIVTVAQALRNSVRANDDIVARIGGDEFAVLVSDLPMPQVEARLRMVATSLAAVALEVPNHEPLKLTISCGVVECAAGDTVESLLERADAALYEAKHLGRNRVVSKVKPTLRDLLQS